ncbi:MAG: TIGR02757 family protein [Nitrospiraceae bacterium]|nr:MAG: TIGR02757 family protein [Nitrospiraceae bacterium]
MLVKVKVIDVLIWTMPVHFRPVRPGPSLKKALDRFYREYNFRERLSHDPIEFPHRYSGPEDIEIAGFIASCFAYGKVGLFKPVIEKVLAPCGRHPARFFKNFTLKSDGKYFEDISYRFNKGKDVLCLAYMLNRALNEWGSLKKLFYYCYNPSMSRHEDTGPALAEFVKYFLNIDTSPVYGRDIRPYGLKQFFPSPENGSACKRMNLFLRWMVRTGDIDLGVWDNIPPSKLIIPLDTHILKISGCLGLTGRKTSDWKTAKEITGSLKKFDPEDPLKYDFALCHHGISRLCRGKKFKDVCSSCAFSSPR